MTGVVTHGHAFGDAGGVAIALALTSGQHALLLRPYSEAVNITLPTKATGSWYLRSDDELAASMPAIVEATTRYAGAHASAVSLVDVIVALSMALEPLGGSQWRAFWSGVPVPDSARYESDGRSVTIDQRADGVRANVTTLAGESSLGASSRDALGALVDWIVERVKTQQAELPTLDEVMYRLKRGVRFLVGGGRVSEEYWWDGTAVMCDLFDEGLTTTGVAGEAELQRQIWRYPDRFR